MRRSRLSWSRGGGGQGGSPRISLSPGGEDPPAQGMPSEDRVQQSSRWWMLGPRLTSASVPVLAAAPVCAGPALGCRVKEW